jgi:restriction system protein
VIREQHKVFVARAGRHGGDEEYALEHGLAIIGFGAYPSLVTTAQPELKPRVAVNFAVQLWTFALGMETRDIVVLPRKFTSRVALGKVTGPYAYRQVGDTRRHTRPVRWIRLDVPRAVFCQDLLYSFRAFLTVCNVSRNDAETSSRGCLGR